MENILIEHKVEWVNRVWDVGEIGKYWSKDIKLQLVYISYQQIVNIVTIDNKVIYTPKLLREYILYTLTTKK
jgi:hypothetical protein